VDDRLRGEALYLVSLTGLILAVLLAHYLGWALLKPVLTAHPTWQAVFWGGQVASVLVLLGIGLVGFRPPVHVTCGPETVTIRQGDRRRTLSASALEDVSLISAQDYHRHYRHYARCQVFISALPDEVLCLHTADGPVIVAMPTPESQAALLDHLKGLRAAAPAAEVLPQG
jgi:hypothetical protein